MLRTDFGCVWRHSAQLLTCADICSLVPSVHPYVATGVLSRLFCSYRVVANRNARLQRDVAITKVHRLSLQKSISECKVACATTRLAPIHLPGAGKHATSAANRSCGKHLMKLDLPTELPGLQRVLDSPTTYSYEKQSPIVDNRKHRPV